MEWKFPDWVLGPWECFSFGFVNMMARGHVASSFDQINPVVVRVVRSSHHLNWLYNTRPLISHAHLITLKASPTRRQLCGRPLDPVALAQNFSSLAIYKQSELLLIFEEDHLTVSLLCPPLLLVL